MPRKTVDPTLAIREMAAAFPEVEPGTSCNQSSFRAGKTAFLYIGPGAGGVGYKAMFKLGPSIEQARALAAEQPERFEVAAWVTTRFTAEAPLPKKIWTTWLRESYELAIARKPAKKQAGAKKKAGPRTQ